MMVPLTGMGRVMNKKRTSLLFLCALSLSYQTSTIKALDTDNNQEKEAREQLNEVRERVDRDERNSKAFITLTLTMGACWILNELGSNKNAIKFGQESDASVTYGELKFVLGFSGLLWALRNWGIEWAGDIAKKLPIAAASLKLVNWNAFQSIVKKLPGGIGKEIGCTTDQRVSSADPRDIRVDREDPLIEESQFALRRGLQTIFIYNLADRLLPLAYKKASQSVSNFFRKKQIVIQP